MCTAISTKSFFGRNLDLERSYGESVVITPRRFPLHFRHKGICNNHYAVIGIATAEDGYPLYFDAINEEGLGCAGLNFPVFSHYSEKGDLPSFELPLYVLSKAKTTSQARDMLSSCTISDEAFSSSLNPTPLHFLIGDRYSSIVVEQTAKGLNIHDNPIGVLTNSPPFPFQLQALDNYMGLSAKKAENRLSKETELSIYSTGMGAIGLPGDLSSQSRFIKAAFTKLNYAFEKEDDVSDFFHILSSVEMQKGCNELSDGVYEITQYSSAGDRDNKAYYYRTYSDSAIKGVKLTKENMEGTKISVFPLSRNQEIKYAN